MKYTTNQESEDSIIVSEEQLAKMKADLEETEAKMKALKEAYHKALNELNEAKDRLGTKFIRSRWNAAVEIANISNKLEK
ncbi:MAG: hypothetical protein ACTHK0_00170 [Ginsengibacter sp.]